MRTIIIILALLIAVPSYAQCVAEVKDVVIDDARGSIIVETQYKLNGVVVDVKANPDPNAIGRTRYTEESGTLLEIRNKAQEDIKQHCENLIIRHAVNVNDLTQRQIDIAKSLTQPIADTLKTQAVGYTTTVNEKVIQFKNKEITVNANGTYSVADIVQ